MAAPIQASQTDQSLTSSPLQVSFQPGGIVFGNGSANGGSGGFGTPGADGLPSWVKWLGVAATLVTLVATLKHLKKHKV